MQLVPNLVKESEGVIWNPGNGPEHKQCLDGKISVDSTKNDKFMTKMWSTDGTGCHTDSIVVYRNDLIKNRSSIFNAMK